MSKNRLQLETGILTLLVARNLDIFMSDVLHISVSGLPKPVGYQSGTLEAATKCPKIDCS
jgi:hypothetical protein